MDWPNERYVRIYTRDTRTLKLIGWEGRAVLWEVIRKCDRAGVMDGVRTPEDLALMVDIPVETVRVAMGRMVSTGAVEITDVGLVVPNYIAAQEAKQTDRQRQRESRARRATAARAVTKRDSIASRPVTEQADSVTAGHTASHAVTSCHSVPSLAVPRSRSLTTTEIQDPTGSPHDDARGTPPDPRCSCPRDLQLTGDQLATLEVGGVPQWAAELITREYVAAAVADQDDKRTPVHWRKCLAKAVMGRWNDPTRRPKKPEDPEQRIREGAAARERYKASVERQRAKVRQRLTAGAKTSQRQNDGEQPTIPKLLAGIGGDDG